MKIRRLWAKDGSQGVSPAALDGGSGELRPWVLHPFLISLYPIVALYAHNVYETSPWEMAWPTGLTISATFVVWAALRFLSGNPSRAGVATSLLVISFFGFKGISQAINFSWLYLLDFWVYSDRSLNPIFPLLFLAIVDGALVFLICRRLTQPARWTRFLNAFTLILVALPTFNAVSARMREPAPTHHDAVLPKIEKRGWLPDIYFIVMDGYARSDVIKDLFAFDNSPFLKHLEDQGFFVARQSTSNYCQTRLSIASTLNANYLDKLIDTSNPDLLPLSDLIKENLVRRSLRPLGYQYVTFSTGFEPTDFPDADVYMMPRPGNPEFTQLLVEMTPIDAWHSEVAFDDRFSALRDRTLYTLDHLSTVAQIKGPTFTFAHIMSPHPPFVFGEGGEDVSPRRLQPKGVFHETPGGKFGTPEYFREAYRKQAVFLTTRIQQVIDQILASSPEPPVIILQSDHGSWLRYHPDDVEATDLRERFGTLNCIYVPDHKIEGLSDDMTSVNTFRAVLKAVVGADLPLLPSRNFFSKFHDPLIFTDVTERLHSPAESKRTFGFPEHYYGLEQQF